jgi:hypothetical protein
MSHLDPGGAGARSHAQRLSRGANVERQAGTDDDLEEPAGPEASDDAVECADHLGAHEPPGVESRPGCADEAAVLDPARALVDDAAGRLGEQLVDG